MPRDERFGRQRDMQQDVVEAGCRSDRCVYPVHELFAACPVVGEYDAATAAPQRPARTIGDYLAGFLAAMGDGRNRLSTRCQPASGAARCELWLKHVDDEDKWAWGIAFRLDRRGRPQPSSVECLGAG